MTRSPAVHKHVVVVGGGIGGLVAALMLAARGARVTLFEAAAQVGGPAGPAVVLEAVFWEAPGVYAAGGASVAVDAPCVLTYRATAGGAVVAVASPDAVDAVVNVVVGSAACPPVRFDLNPAARVDYLGQSLVATLACPPPPACCTVTGWARGGEM